MATTPGNQAVVRYIEETTVGTTPANPDFLLFSPEVQNLKWGLDTNQEESRDIGSMDVHEYYNLQNAFSLEVEFNLYDVERFWDFITRKVDGSVRSYSIEVIPNKNDGVGNTVYFRGRGWKPNTVNLKGDTENPYRVTITFEGGLWAAPVTVDPGVGTGSREVAAAITDPLRLFQASVITLDGVAVATLLNSFDLTIEHNIGVHYTAGSKDPVVVGVRAGGPRLITGTADLSFDSGYKAMWDRVVAGAAHVIAVPFGPTPGDPLLTLTGVYFPKIDAEVGVDDDVLMGGQEFKASSLTTGVVV